MWKSADFYYEAFPPFREPWTEEKLFDSLLSKAEWVGECLIWQRSKDQDGYGWFYGGRANASGAQKNEKAHRASLSFYLGRDLLPGMKACHTCHNPSCINPIHLYEGTQKNNEQDKILAGRHANQKKTHCPSGHMYTEETTYHRPDNPSWRDCLVCRRKRSKQ